ncbi:MAG: hypothetical protein K2N35_10545 [Muribaculaceae bacterium]|nr:hypothetical protein [Muribaculaceae bacterium]
MRDSYKFPLLELLKRYADKVKDCHMIEYSKSSEYLREVLESEKFRNIYRKLPITFGVDESDGFIVLSDHDIEFLICHLEDFESFEFILKRARDLKNTGKIVLAVGILPFYWFSEEYKDRFYESLERYRLLKCVVDGLIVLKKDSFWEESDLYSKEIDNRINTFIHEIVQGLADILTPGVRNIDLLVLKELLHACHTYVVARGWGNGANRVRNALRQVREVFSFCGFDMILARAVVIKIIEPNEDPLSKEEQELIKNTISGFTDYTDIHLCLDQSSSEYDEIEIIVLSVDRINLS